MTQLCSVVLFHSSSVHFVCSVRRSRHRQLTRDRQKTKEIQVHLLSQQEI